MTKVPLSESPHSNLPLLNRISDYVKLHAEWTPDAEALVLDERRLTYAAMNSEIERLARALIASGIRRGDRVATLATPSPEFFMLFLATASVGAIWVGLNPRHQLDEFSYFLRDSEPKLLFARSRFEDRSFELELSQLQEKIPSLKTIVIIDDGEWGAGCSLAEFVAQGEHISDEVYATATGCVLPSDPALIVYTSGTTGKPKGALLPHRGLVRCSLVHLTYWLTKPLRVLNYAPINHIGSVGDISCFALVGGGTIVFMERFNAGRTLSLIESERITWFLAVPTVLQMCLDDPQFFKQNLSSLQVVVWEGAPASRELVERLHQAFGNRLSSAYGLTETVGCVTFVPPCGDIDLLAETIGMRHPAYEVRIATPEGDDALPGQAGEVLIRGDFVMAGYWRRPADTAETIDANGWLHTGDLALIQPDGNLKLIGRLKDMFISGGYNIYPREVELVLESFAGVASVAVVAAPDKLYGEVGIAFVTREQNVNMTVEELLNFCRKHLANYKIPKQIFIMDDLPKLPIGKIDKTALRRRVLESMARSGSSVD